MRNKAFFCSRSVVYSAIVTELFLLSLLISPFVEAQDWAKAKIENLQRVDLRDLGYPLVNEIPPNSSSITSLTTARDGTIYGATSGNDSYLFLFNPKINKVRHLGKIPKENGTYHSLVEDSKGYIYIGGGINILEEIPISGNDSVTIEKSLWNDIKKRFSVYPGGHLYRYRPEKSNRTVKLPEMESEVEDLGIPLANNAIYALTINPSGTVIYGLTYPDGHLFIYDIKEKKFTDKGTIDKKIIFHGPRRDLRSLSSALICDDSGRVFTSGTNGKIIYYDSLSGKIINTDITIPGDYNYLQFFEDYTIIEYLTKDSSGMIYGGTSDGYLFSLDTKSLQLKNLGKPRAARRIRCLTTASDGKIYIIAGERKTTEPCQLYSYDPREHEFHDLGLLIVDRSPYYYWRGQQFDSMTTGSDGTIYLGESERKSHLFILIP